MSGQQERAGVSGSDEADWTGQDERECGEHHTVGPHRAWCLDCTEWCYPEAPCRGCELPSYRAALNVVYARGIADASEDVRLWTREWGEQFRALLDPHDDGSIGPQNDK